MKFCEETNGALNSLWIQGCSVKSVKHRLKQATGRLLDVNKTHTKSQWVLILMAHCSISLFQKQIYYYASK